MKKETLEKILKDRQTQLDRVKGQLDRVNSIISYERDSQKIKSAFNTSKNDIMLHYLKINL